MTVRIIKAAAKLALPVFVAAFAVSAFAEDVTFTTTGEFSCGTAVGCTTQTFDSDPNAQITIANNGNTLVLQAIGYFNPGVQAGNPALDSVNVMTFDDTAGTKSKGTVNTAGATFTMTIDQSVPSATPGSGTLSGPMSGTINASASNVAIAFTNTSLVLGNITYTLNSPIWTIKNPGIGTTGVTTDTATVTPEPTFMMLTGLGFSGLAFVAYRRRRTV